MGQASIRAILALALFAAASCGGETFATRPADVSPASARALEWLETQQGVVDPSGKLVLVDERHDASGEAHVRYQQIHAGIPVFGSEIIVHLAPDSTARVTGQLVDISKNAPTSPDLSRQQAMDTAARESCAASVEEAEVVYREVDKNDFRLAWRVPGRNGLFRCDVFVSADEPVVLNILNRSPSVPAGK